MAENVKVSKAAAARKKVVRFFKEIKTELKKVVWPTRDQLINYTITVVFTCLVVGAIIWIADFGLAKVIKLMIAR